MIVGKILVVDDNPNICSAIEMLLQEEFESVDVLYSPKNLLNRIQQGEFDTILLDMNFTSGQKSGSEGQHTVMLNLQLKRLSLEPLILC